MGHGAYLDLLAQSDGDDLADSLDLRNVWEVSILENNRRFGYSVAAFFEDRLILPPAPVSKGQKANISVRATQIALSRQRIQGITIQNQMPGKILRIIPRRHGALVEIDAGYILVAEVNGKTVEDLKLRVGDNIYCLIKAQSVEYPDA